jgi:transmembrane sensor
MNSPSKNPGDAAAIERAAAEWVLRCDRGLTAAEQDELSHWLAADSRHRDALALQRWSWEELDRLAGLQASIALPDPDLIRPAEAASATRRSRSRRAWWGGIAAAVTIGAGALFFVRAPEARPMVTAALAAPLERRTLDDGTRVDCNRGAQLEVEYTATARHVRLVRGEANFDVAKDPARPFHVTAGDVTLRAVGTVFNVRLDAHVVEVVVREGQVQMGSTAPARLSPGAPLPLLHASQRVVIPHTPAAQLLLSTLTPQELEARLAWQPRLLDFNDAPLEQIVASFNRHNVVRVTLKDRELQAVRLSATFRSDNVEGFLRLLASDFGIRVEWRSEREVVLRTLD